MSAKVRKRLLEQTVERFEAQLRQVVAELAQGILEAEFARMSMASTPAKIATPKRRRARSAATSRGKTSSAPAPSIQPVDHATAEGAWTRESIVQELGRWLTTSRNLDAAFLRRHGPRGLVDAAKRNFGRFDAALNAANLAIAAKMRGNPPRDTTQSWPSLRELARRQRERRTATNPAT